MAKLKKREEGFGEKGLTMRKDSSGSTWNDSSCSSNGMGKEVVKAGLGLLLSGGDVTGAVTGVLVGAAVDKIMR